MAEHKRNGPTAPSGELSPLFNVASLASTEIENKFILAGEDATHFGHFIEEFTNKGWVKNPPETFRLLSRQIDTEDLSLRKAKTTLRVRGRRTDNGETETRVVEAPDICLKTGDTVAEGSGALERKEYEARVESYTDTSVNLAALFDEYPMTDEHEHNQPLYDALDGINPEDLRDLFEIDCVRTRLIMEIPEQVSGLTNKRFFIELNLDDIHYRTSGPDGKAIIFHHDLEVEYEPILKVCKFSAQFSNGTESLVCSRDITETELAQAMNGMRKYLLAFAEKQNINIKENSVSKANRGFANLDRFTMDNTSPIQERSLPKDMDQQASTGPS